MTVGDIVKVTQYLVRPERHPSVCESAVGGARKLAARFHAASGFTTDMAGGFGGG